MKQLDLSKQSEQTERAQVPAKSPSVAQERGERRKREEDKNLVASNNDLTNDGVSLTARANTDERKVNGNEVQDGPMEIAEDNDRRNVSIHEVIVNRTADTTDKSTVNMDLSPLTPTYDPRFYVRTSFAASTPGSPRCRTNLGSNFIANMTVSPSISFRSSQSFRYHDYCLSEGEFDITLPSQSTSSEVAKVTARSKEAEIFRQIEGDAFDEKTFFNNAQVPLELDHLTADDDVTMLPM